MTTHLQAVPDATPLPIPALEKLEVFRVTYMTGLEGSAENPVRAAVVYYGADGEPLWTNQGSPI